TIGDFRRPHGRLDSFHCAILRGSLRSRFSNVRNFLTSPPETGVAALSKAKPCILPAPTGASLWRTWETGIWQKTHKIRNLSFLGPAGPASRAARPCASFWLVR